MDRIDNCKITVIGVGGVGGYLSALLAARYPNVTLVARGQRKQSIEAHGIRMNSDYKGSIISHPAAVVSSITEIQEVQDFIFVCVKNYSLDKITEQLAPISGSRTLIVPVMNGVEAGGKIRSALQTDMVADSTIHIVSYADSDYAIRQIGDYAYIRFGIQDPDSRQKSVLDQLYLLLREADIDCEQKTDIEATIWEKYMLNCAFNVLTAYYDTDVAGLRRDEQRKQEYRTLLEEAVAVAKAQNIDVEPGFAEIQYKRFVNDLSGEASSSLKRDMHEGKPSELETFSGYLTRKAKEIGVPVPLSEKIYNELQGRR